MQNSSANLIHRSIKPLLSRVGLNQSETDIYLALLSLGSAKASDVAKLAKQARTHTYPLLRELENKGLVSEIEEGGKIIFVAEPPERLLNFLKDKERESQELQTLISGALPMLHSLSSEVIDTPRISVLKGFEGMKQIYRDILVNEFIGMINIESMYNTFGKPIGEILLGEDRHYTGRDLFVNNDGAKRYLKDWPSSDEYQIRLLPEGVTFRTDTVCFGHTVAFFAFDDDKTVIRMDNKNVADSYRVWFELLWDLGIPPEAQNA